ncbi:MAG: protein kinase [Methylococcaceae bacterium]
MKQLSISLAHASDKGIKTDNEDFVGALIPNDNQLFYKGITLAIADGMSGSEAGKQASHCCVASFLSDYYSTPDSWSVKQAGQKILSATNSWLYSQGQVRYQSTKGMVSTLSVLVLKSTTAFLFHIGDSRIYRLRQGQLEQLTRDHRIWLANDKSYLNRAMGIEPRLEVDYQAIPLELNDVFLMTTDGIHDFIDEKSLKQLLLSDTNLENCAQAILQQASDNHSDDNLSCQLIKIESLPEIKEDEIIRHHLNLAFPPPLQQGMMLDNYQIISELHASKRTQIYKALDTITNSLVVLKTPSVFYDDDTYYIEHFLHEEWAGKRINHENILKVVNSHHKKSYLYYVTEFLDGITLRDWLFNNPKPDIKTARKLIEQIAKGLRAFHRMEMLHQDLKPENIMITHEGIVKIIDFGSVKIAGIAEILPLDIEDDNVLGTLNYTAPEYHLGQRASIKSDLFSLGVIAYEIFNNALPFGQDFPEKPNKVNLAKLHYVPSFYCNDMIPPWLDGALKKATALNPVLRYETLSEFLYDLSTPNPAFLKNSDFIPLIERNPLVFWKVTTLILLLTNLISLCVLL